MTRLRNPIVLEDGSCVHVIYDPDAPCLGCGEPVVAASAAGIMFCPWCDRGKDRQENPLPLRLKGDPWYAQWQAKRAAYFAEHPDRMTRLAPVAAVVVEGVHG